MLHVRDQSISMHFRPFTACAAMESVLSKIDSAEPVEIPKIVNIDGSIGDDMDVRALVRYVSKKLGMVFSVKRKEDVLLAFRIR